jgi:hypothetical protein
MLRLDILTASWCALSQHACAGCTHVAPKTATIAAFVIILVILIPLFPLDRGMMSDGIYQIFNMQGKAK